MGALRVATRPRLGSIEDLVAKIEAAVPERLRPFVANPVVGVPAARERAPDGIDVAQLLSDAVTLTPPAAVAAPAWVQAPQLAAQAVVAALREPRDTTVRTLSDLLGGRAAASGRDAARDPDAAKGADKAAARRGRLGLGPLTAQLGSGPEAAALLAEVARGCLAELKPRLVGAGITDPQVLSLALQVLGVLGEHKDLEREVGTTLMRVLETAAQTAIQGEAVLQAA